MAQPGIRAEDVVDGGHAYSRSSSVATGEAYTAVWR